MLHFEPSQFHSIDAETDHQNQMILLTYSRCVLSYVYIYIRSPAQVATGDTTMGASGVLALVDRRITPQAQGAKVRVQGILQLALYILLLLLQIHADTNSVVYGQ